MMIILISAVFETQQTQLSSRPDVGTIAVVIVDVNLHYHLLPLLPSQQEHCLVDHAPREAGAIYYNLN